MQMITVASLATSVAALIGTGREWKMGIPYEIERSPWIEDQHEGASGSLLATSAALNSPHLGGELGIFHGVLGVLCALHVGDLRACQSGCQGWS